MSLNTFRRSGAVNWRVAFKRSATGTLSVGTLSVNNVKTPKVELLYWTAILFSNTLGTALGDFLADTSGLGFAGGAFLIASLLSLVLAAHYFTQISPVVLGCVCPNQTIWRLGDVLTKVPEKGGLVFGTIGSSIVLASILGVCILFTTLKQRRLAVARLSNDD